MQSDEQTTDKLYCNTGEHRYAKVNNLYYRWNLGKGWSQIDEAKLPTDLAWSPMPDKMWAVIQPELPQ